MLKRPWVFAVIYAALSLSTEAAFIVIGRLKVPDDNAILAPIVLTIPPVVTAIVCEHRRPRALATAAISASVLTLVLTLIAGRLTGISTGLTLPVIVRLMAGFGAGLVAGRGAVSIRG